ncbi:MAG: hypothetical protein EB034_25005 [Verrucomicrobia bacterium]|nr:hypothetical protein [Verrucomicrobiota bacterium]
MWRAVAIPSTAVGRRADHLLLSRVRRGVGYRISVLLVIVVILAAVGGLMALLLGAVSNKTK